MNRDIERAIEHVGKLYIAKSSYLILLEYLGTLDSTSVPFDIDKLIEEVEERFGKLDSNKDFYPAPPLSKSEHPEIHKLISWKIEE